MKHLRLALVAVASTLGIAYAQDEERRAPPVEIPDFSNLDEYIYEPKSTLSFGVRYLSGAKTTFAGQGRITSQNIPGDATTPNILRLYQDGAIQPDTRVMGRVDASGQPVINPDTGLQYVDPIPPDGRTNTWNYTDLSQLSRPGSIAFRDYSADIIDTTTRSKDSGSTMGMDLVMHRDMGKFFGGRVAWNLTVGMSINDISADTTGAVTARLNTLTDYYSFYPQPGMTLPEPPYSAPSSITETVLDANGNPVVSEIDGTTEVRTTDTTVLLGSQPTERTNTSVINDTSVMNRWKVKGAYYTFRAGPTVWIPITTRLRASVSVGAALVYAGSTYTVTETLFPDVGAEISATESSEDYKLLPGYYADATLQFDLTERAGFYAGAVYQSAGSYTQAIDNANANYTTKIDLSNQSGVRAGMSIRF